MTLGLIVRNIKVQEKNLPIYYLIPEIKKILYQLTNHNNLGIYHNINGQWAMDNIFVLLNQYLSRDNYIIYHDRIVITSDTYQEQGEILYNQLNIYFKNKSITKVIYLKKKQHTIDIDNDIRDIPTINYDNYMTSK